MQQKIINFLATINICVSIIVYILAYQTIEDAHPNGKGWVQFFALLCCAVVLVNGLSFYTMIAKISKVHTKFLSLLAFCFLVTFPFIIEATLTDYYNILCIPIMITIGVIPISLFAIKKGLSNCFLF